MMGAEAKQLQRQPDRSKAAHDAEASVGKPDSDVSTPQQEDAFIPKSRKSGEPAEKARKQKQTRIGGKHIPVLDQRGERTNNKTTHHVDGKGAERESPRGRVMQNDSAQFVAAD